MTSLKGTVNMCICLQGGDMPAAVEEQAGGSRVSGAGLRGCHGGCHRPAQLPGHCRAAADRHARGKHEARVPCPLEKFASSFSCFRAHSRDDVPLLQMCLYMLAGKAMCDCNLCSVMAMSESECAERRDSMLSPMIVMLLRLLTSAEIQRRTDFFAPFVMVRPSPEL